MCVCTFVLQDFFAVCLVKNPEGNEGKAMKIKDIDLYNMPDWLGRMVDAVTNQCEEMIRKNPHYREYFEESERILDGCEFVSTFLSTTVDKEAAAELELPTMEELKALSRYLELENDQMELRNIQFYLLGCRHVVEF